MAVSDALLQMIANPKVVNPMESYQQGKRLAQASRLADAKSAQEQQQIDINAIKAKTAQGQLGVAQGGLKVRREEQKTKADTLAIKQAEEVRLKNEELLKSGFRAMDVISTLTDPEERMAGLNQVQSTFKPDNPIYKKIEEIKRLPYEQQQMAFKEVNRISQSRGYAEQPTDTRTTYEKNLVNAGYTKGTPEFQEKMEQMILQGDKFIEMEGGQAIVQTPDGKFKALSVENLDDLPPVITPEDKQKRVEALRNTIDKEGTAFRKVEGSYERIQEVGKAATGAGDLALIFNYMKMLDPGSVVRESEFKTAEHARAWMTTMEDEGRKVPSLVQGAIQKFNTGAKLLPDQRKDFLARTEELYVGSRNAMDRSISKVLQRADEDGVSRQSVIGKKELEGYTKRKNIRRKKAGVSKNLPEGSKQIGTFKGKPVYVDLEGNQWIGEE